MADVTFPLPSPGTPEESFRVLDRLLVQLTAATGAQHAMVGELAGPNRDRVLVHRALAHGRPGGNFDYGLADTPCADVYEGSVCVVPQDVARLYPRDVMLSDLRVEGYAGVPLVGEGDQPQGILVLLFEFGVTDPDGVADILEQHAVRVAMELERIRFETRLAQSERRYRTLVESSSDGIVVHRDFEILYVNQAAARMVGFDSPAEALAQDSILDRLPPEEQERMLAFKTAREQGAAVPRDYDMDVLHVNGERRRMRVLVSTVEWDDGKEATQALFTDITARQEEDARTQQAIRLESIGKLTGGIAHDFNNLLAVVIGNLELLREDLPAGEQSEMLEQAMTAAERGAEMTRRLLSFARRQPLQPQAVDLAGLFEETRALLERTLSADIELSVNSEARVPVLADPTQLQSALVNLALNGADAIPTRGRLAIHAWDVAAPAMQARFPAVTAAAPHVCIEVADSGVGMSADVRARAFEPFFSTKNESRGSGLGLSMVHGFVRQSQGQVEIESSEETGTRVRMYLPVADDPPTTAAVEESAESSASAGGRILVVEDEQTVREVTVAMLESFGYQVQAAEGGETARALLGTGPFDLLLTDVVLPGERGPEIAADAMRRFPDLRVMFMSGYAESEVFRNFTPNQPVVLLQKPFRRETLRQRVAEVMSGAAPGS